MNLPTLVGPHESRRRHRRADRGRSPKIPATVGHADVDVWRAVIGDIPKDLALQAVRDHLREQPGVWLEPGHVYQRARVFMRDQLEREPAELREARQAELEAKVAEDAAERAHPLDGPIEAPNGRNATGC